MPYLNAKPLVHGLNEVRFGVPSALALALEREECDLVAALSIGATLDRPEWRVLPSLGVAADGPVRTVLLLHRHPLEAVEDLAYDPASRTSNLLARWIVRDASGKDPGVVPHSPNRVVIGDPAFAHSPSEGTDLAEAWKRSTGLPFVFAGWVAGRRLSLDSRRLVEIDQFLAERHGGTMDRLEEIARDQSATDPAVAVRYLRSNIEFGLTSRHREGADRFARELQAMGEGSGRVPWAC